MSQSLSIRSSGIWHLARVVEASELRASLGSLFRDVLTDWTWEGSQISGEGDRFEHAVIPCQSLRGLRQS